MWRRTKLLTCLFLAGIAIVWLAVATVQAQTQNPAVEPDTESNTAEAASDLATLIAEVQELRERVTQLEEQLAKMQGGIQPLEFQYTPNFGAVPPASPPPAIPNRRPQGEINGVPYYVIPLGNE